MQPGGNQTGNLLRVLPSSLSCGHPECSDLWKGCLAEGEHTLIVPFDPEVHTNNVISSMKFRDRLTYVAPIRAEAASAAKAARIPRIATFWLHVQPWIAGSRRLDTDALDLWLKHAVDGLTTRWTQGLEEVKRRSRDVTAGPDSDSAAIFVDDGPKYWLGKTTHPSLRDKRPGARNVVVISIHANPPMDWAEAVPPPLT